MNKKKGNSQNILPVRTGVYRVCVTKDVREKDSGTEILEIKAKSPADAMEKVLKSRPPYTGVYCV